MEHDKEGNTARHSDKMQAPCEEEVRKARDAGQQYSRGADRPVGRLVRYGVVPAVNEELVDPTINGHRKGAGQE